MSQPAVKHKVWAVIGVLGFHTMVIGLVVGAFFFQTLLGFIVLGFAMYLVGILHDEEDQR